MPDPLPSFPVLRQDLDLLLDGEVGVISAAPSVFVNGVPIMTLESLVSDSGVMVTGSPGVFAEGKPVCRPEDLAFCASGVKVAVEGSPDVFTA